MATITFEYDEKDKTVSGMFGVIAAIPGVRSFINTEIAQKSKAQRNKELLDRAKRLDASINKKAPKMTMEEIIQEIIDYRNGK